MKSGVLRARNSTITQSLCANALSCPVLQMSSYPHKCVKAIVLGDFVAAMVKLQQFVLSEPDEIHHRSRVATATNSTS